MKYALICPVCSEDLMSDSGTQTKNQSVTCQQHHLFDFAKQGYLNLLLSQHKKSKHPGDTLDMVQARTHFLSSGFYDGINQFLQEECLKHISHSTTQVKNNNEAEFNYCDLACGEGFYTDKLHQAFSTSPQLTEQFKSFNSIGLDISTPAIKAACKKTKDIQWLVASLARIPISNHSQNLVTGLFFHFDLQEIKRILKPGGIFVMATTGAEHLIELRKELYDTLKDETTKDFSTVQGEINHLEKLSFRDYKTLNSASEIVSLLKMTPHYWRCTQEKKQHIESLMTLNITIDIQFDIFIRT